MQKSIFLFLTLQCLILTAQGQSVQEIHSIDSLVKTEQIKTPYTFKSFRKDFGVSIGLIGLGVFATTDNDILSNEQVRDWRNEHYPNFQNHADDFLQYAPVIMTAGVHFFDDQTGNSWGMQGKLLLKSFVFMNAMVLPLKSITHELRPDGSAYNSFPSGHTATAFMGAEFLRKEYGKKYPLIAVGGYAIATGVGVFRILNNKHWISDVLAGAGIGMASVNIAYLTTSKSKLKNESLTISPVYMPNGMGFSLVYKLNQSPRSSVR